MIKRFAQCLREYKWTALVSPVCMIGEVAMEVTIPLVMADLYDYGIAVGNMTVVWQKALQLLICAIVSLMFGVMSANYASKAATGFARNLRHDMYYRVQDFSFSNIDKFSSASIVTRLTSDVANIQMAFQMMIRMAIRCPMMLILAMVSSMRSQNRQLRAVSAARPACSSMPLSGAEVFVARPSRRAGAAFLASSPAQAVAALPISSSFPMVSFRCVCAISARPSRLPLPNIILRCRAQKPLSFTSTRREGSITDAPMNTSRNSCSLCRAISHSGHSPPCL